jgi:hypothetical protein
MGDASAPQAVLGELLAVGFQQRLAPLRIWAEQPAWCAWFVGKEGASQDDVCHAVEYCSIGCPVGVEHILVVRVDKADSGQRWLKLKLPNSIVGVLLLCENGAAKRPLPLLANASVAHLYAAWVRHCQNGTGNAHEHLLISADHLVHTVGVSCCAPDLAYHAKRWAGRIRAALMRDWMVDVPEAPSLALFEPALASLRSLLPEQTGQGAPDYLVSSINSSGDGFHICVADERFAISGEFTALSCRRPERSNSSRSQLLAWLSSIKGVSSFLQFAVLANLKKILSQNSAAQGRRWMQASRDYLSQPADAKGFLNRLRQRLEQTANWARERMNASLVDNDHQGDFRQSECAALASISAIPNPGGLLLRLALLGVALGTIAAAPMWVSTGPQQWQTEVAHKAAFGAVGFFLLISLVAPAVWYCSAARAFAVVARARMNVIQGHLCSVAGLLTGALAENGQRLGETVATWGKAFDTLRQELEGDLRAPPASKALNKNAFFRDDALDALCLRRMNELVGAAHCAFLARIGGSAQVTFQTHEWRDALTEAARTVADTEIRKLTFAEWMAELNPSSEQRKCLAEDLVREARLPTVTVRPAANPPPVLLVADSEWAKSSEGLGQVICFDAKARTVMSLSVMPIHQEKEP